MSDLMLYGVLEMPYEMAMSGEISRYQFWSRVQEAAKRLKAAEARLAELDRVPVSTPQQSAQRASVEEGEVEYELYEVSGDDVLMVAGTSGKRAYEEILHYAAQYAQDGPIEIHKLVRTKLSIAVAAPSPAPQGEQA